MNEPSLSSIPNLLLSTNVSDVIGSTNWINNCWDRESLRIIATEILPRLNSHKTIDLGGAIISNNLRFTIAIAKLKLSKTQKCLCLIVKKSNFFNPKELEEQGQITILEQSHNAQTWSSKYFCQCTTCDLKMQVAGEAGWHLPWWEWH